MSWLCFSREGSKRCCSPCYFSPKSLSLVRAPFSEQRSGFIHPGLLFKWYIIELRTQFESYFKDLYFLCHTGELAGQSGFVKAGSSLPQGRWADRKACALPGHAGNNLTLSTECPQSSQQQSYTLYGEDNALSTSQSRVLAFIPSLFFLHRMDHCLLTLGVWVRGKGCWSH